MDDVERVACFYLQLPVNTSITFVFKTQLFKGRGQVLSDGLILVDKKKLFRERKLLFWAKRS